MNIHSKGFLEFSTNYKLSTIEVAQKLGKIIETNYFDTVQILKPKNMETEAKNSYSGNYGLGEFPLHTDMAHWYMPPKYILLRCIVPASRTYTNLINLKKVFQDTEFNYNLSHFTPRKKINSQTAILHLYKNDLCRWDNLFLKPFNKYAQELEPIISQKLKQSHCEHIYLKNVGDCLLIDNWSMAHGRSAIDEASLMRCYERIYLSEIF